MSLDDVRSKDAKKKKKEKVRKDGDSPSFTRFFTKFSKTSSSESIAKHPVKTDDKNNIIKPNNNMTTNTNNNSQLPHLQFPIQKHQLLFNSKTQPLPTPTNPSFQLNEQTGRCTTEIFPNSFIDTSYRNEQCFPPLDLNSFMHPTNTGMNHNEYPRDLIPSPTESLNSYPSNFIPSPTESLNSYPSQFSNLSVPSPAGEFLNLRISDTINSSASSNSAVSHDSQLSDYFPFQNSNRIQQILKQRQQQMIFSQFERAQNHQPLNKHASQHKNLSRKSVFSAFQHPNTPNQLLLQHNSRFGPATRHINRFDVNNFNSNYYPQGNVENREVGNTTQFKTKNVNITRQPSKIKENIMRLINHFKQDPPSYGEVMGIFPLKASIDV